MPSPVLRHQMPMVTYRTHYAWERDPSQEENHGRRGFVRIHRTFEDWFRKSIEVLQSNPLLEEGGGVMTFNRSSLIKYLNAEIAYFNRNPVGNQPALPPALHIGRFGGWIGGSSNERIRIAYQRVFECYQASYQSLQTPRFIDKNSLIRCPVIEETPELSIEGRRLACSKEYLEGAAQVFLFCTDEPLRVEGLHSYNRAASSDLCIGVRDTNIDIPILMEAIAADGTFLGSHGNGQETSAPILIRQIYVNYSELGEERPEVDLVVAIVEWQRAQYWSAAKNFNIKTIEQARVERDNIFIDIFFQGWCLYKGSFVLERGDNSWSTLPVSRLQEGVVCLDLYEVTDDSRRGVELPHQKGNFYMRIKILNSQFATECLEGDSLQSLVDVIGKLKVKGMTHSYSINVDLIMISIDEMAVPNARQREVQELRLQGNLKGILETRGQRWDL